MPTTPNFDIQEAHKYFSAHCFNKTWDYIEMASRTPEQDFEMLNCCRASLWHWSQRSDATPTNLSVGYWQASRVYALLGIAVAAKNFGLMSLEKSTGLEPFYVGYAHEALARSAMVAGDKSVMTHHLEIARQHCDLIADVDSKKLLAADLETIR